MRAIHFVLSGKTAFFKKPDVNSFAYFTYNNIHKIALLGILGAVAGFGGYNQQSSESVYPEFYEKLKDLKVSILPSLENKGYFSKKIQTFNNSVGYASREEGGNLIVQEQWLESPCWDIFLLDDDSIDRQVFNKIVDYLLQGKCEYIPYLGKNDHPAVISAVQDISLKESDANHIDSLFSLEGAKLGRFTYDGQPKYMFREVAPVSLNEGLNVYEYKELVLTNCEVLNISENPYVYDTGEATISFF